VPSAVTGARAWVEYASSWYCGSKLVGYSLTVRLAAPVTFAATVPTVGAPAGSYAYAITPVAMHVAGANEFLVTVDGKSHEVVGVEPEVWPDDTGRGPVTSAATTGPSRDAGGHVPASCWQQHD
jgi:hypothetical protein